MEIRHDFSIRVSLGQDREYLLDPRYDRVDMFRELGHAVLMVIGEEGVTHEPIRPNDAEKIIQAGIPHTERQFITESEHETYLKVQAALLEEWFKDGA